MLHTGTMGAVLYYFWPRWRRRVEGEGGFAFVLMVLLATVCTGILGLGLKLVIEKLVLERLLGHTHAEVEELFRSLPLIGLSLLTVGIVIIVAGRQSVQGVQAQVQKPQAVLIGLVQGLCLPFRGFSRSGATISTALLCGLSQQAAEEFSFALALLVTPPVIVREFQRLAQAQALTAMGGGLTPGLSGLIPGMAGMVLSFGAGLVALQWLSAVLERGRWQYFGYYCVFAAGALAFGCYVRI